MGVPGVPAIVGPSSTHFERVRSFSPIRFQMGENGILKGVDELLRGERFEFVGAHKVRTRLVLKWSSSCGHRLKHLAHQDVYRPPVPPLPTQRHAALFKFGEPPGLPPLPPLPPLH